MAKKLQHRVEALAFINHLLKSLSDPDSLLRVVLDSAVSLTGAERGFILLKDQTGQLHFRTARSEARIDLTPDEVQVSRKLIDKVVTTGRPQLTLNAAKDPRFKDNESVKAHDLRSLLCVPLTVRGQVEGAIYLDNRVRAGAFTDQDVELIAALADQAAVALDQAWVREQTVRLLDHFERYMSPEVAEKVLASGQIPTLGGDRAEVTILCGRILGISELVDEREAEQVLGLLNHSFTWMVDMIFAFGGTVRQFSGEEILVIFGAPVAMPDHAEKAMQCALQLREAMAWDTGDELRLAIGLHSGEVVVGNVGSPERMEYAAVGDVVNTAHRILSLAPRLCPGASVVLASREVLERGPRLGTRDLGEFEVKGKRSRVWLYQL